MKRMGRRGLAIVVVVAMLMLVIADITMGLAATITPSTSATNITSISLVVVAIPVVAGSGMWSMVPIRGYHSGKVSAGLVALSTRDGALHRSLQHENIEMRS